MKIVVCVKAIKSEFVYPNEVRNEKFLINPYDLYTLENCIALKKQLSCEIICICMGPVKSEEILIKCLAMGVDRSILLNDHCFSGSDTVATTYILAKAIERIGNVNLVVSGQKAIDGETGQVTYGLAERLGYNCIDNVEQFISVNEQFVTLFQKLGAHMVNIRVKLPVSVAFNQFLLRQPSISLIALKKAKNRGIEIWTASDIEADIELCGIYGSRTKVLDIKNEFKKKQTKVVEGTQMDKAKLMLDLVGRRVDIS